MASRGAVRQAPEVAGEYLRKGAQVYIEGQLAPVAGRITVSPVTLPKFLLSHGHHADAGTCRRCSDSAGTKAEAGTKKGGAKTKGRGRKARSRSLSRNRRRVTITGFQTIPVLIGLTVITAPPRSVRGITER